MDAKVAPFAHKIGPAQLERLIEEAKARFDPEATEAERLAAAQAGHFDIALDDVGVNGRVQVDGDVDLADALDLEAAVAADAHQQLPARLDRLPRRTPRQGGRQPGPPPTHPRPDREQPARAEPGAAGVRWCCTSTSTEAAVLGAGGLARLQETRGPVTAEQVREWCANPDTQISVQPVLDLAEHLHVGSYEASARLKLQTQLRDLVCAFAFCFRPAEACDCEHRVPPEDGGPTCTLQPSALLPQPPPRQDHRRLELHHHRTRRLPVAQPAGLPVPQRPHRHPRRHPGCRPAAPRPRVPRTLRRHRHRPLTTPPHTPLSTTASGDEGVSVRSIAAERRSQSATGTHSSI